MTTQDISMFFKKARLGPPTLNHGGDRNDAFRGAGEAWPQPKLPQPKPKVLQPKVPQLLTKAKKTTMWRKTMGFFSDEDGGLRTLPLPNGELG